MCARVLIVDDDPVNAGLFGYLLKAFGHDPVIALGGEAALEETIGQVPDLVLCDIHMRGMHGFELLRRLRDDQRFAAVQIVGVTALAMLGDRERILAAGFDGYVAKPITPETFVGEIEKYLPPDLARPASARQRGVNDGLTLVPPVTAGPPRKNIGYALVVDDSAPNIQLMRHLIGSLGVEVRAASNAADAMRLARALTPKLIISDIHMPEISGIELAETFKADATLKDVPFFLISSSSVSRDDERRASEAGVDGLLLRPVDAETILQQIIRWMPAEPVS